MPKRKEIKGVASTLAHHFITRFNTAERYWAIGKFYKIATENCVNHIRLNLISGYSSLNTEFNKEVARRYYSFMVYHLNKIGFKDPPINNAFVELEYNITLSEKNKISTNTEGDPFKCKVTLIDDLNKKYVYETFGRCRQHDPQLEQET